MTVTSWDDFPGLRHADEVVTAHEGTVVADRGAPLISQGDPAPVDKGPRPGEVVGAVSSQPLVQVTGV